MAWDAGALQFAALAGVGLAGASLAVAFRAGVRVDTMKRSMAVLQGGTKGSEADREIAADIVGVVQRLDRENAELFGAARRSLQHVGLVRFDAFEDMGGRLSFSAALLDIDGNGIVLTSINGRNETRMYAKPVEAAVSKYHLSDEEQAAIRRALGGDATKDGKDAKDAKDPRDPTDPSGKAGE